MFGAVQLGLLAACVVLFVPMGMAGWHLSRNKVLFFSGALFITLAVGVHITPYFPSVINFVSSVSSVSVTDNRESCISLLHEIVYNVKSVGGSENVLNNNASWNWEKSSIIDACEFQKLSRADASDLLNGSWIAVAGDSQARLIVISLLNLVLGQDEMDSVRLDLFKRHSNYQIIIDSIGLKLDFVWAPYSTNLTDFMVNLKRNRNYPEVIVIGAGLWHMLHITDSLSYGDSLVSVRESASSLLPISHEVGISSSVTVRSPHIFWLGMPELINSMLNTEEKRVKMNDVTLLDYERAVYRSKLLREYGGPLWLLDVKLLSKKCGRLCTGDGMHYNQAVYDAAVHVMLNALLIESQQTL